MKTYYGKTVHHFYGHGKIVGVIAPLVKGTSPGYIIEDTSGHYPNEDYPYTHIVEWGLTEEALDNERA